MRPFCYNHRIKHNFLIIWVKKYTATHAGDAKPKEVIKSDSGEVETKSEETETPDPKPKEKLTILKPTYINPGMSTKTLMVSRSHNVTRLK